MKKLLLILIIIAWNNINLDCQINNLRNIKNKANVTTQINSNQFYFLENKGQWDEKVLFMAQSKSLRTWITKNSIVFEQFEKLTEKELKPTINKDEIKTKEIKAHAVGMEFVNPSVVNVKKGELGPTKFNFIIGNDISKHRTDVLQYYEVSIENIYEGIDMRYYFDNGELRYDFIVKPGANPNLIEMEIKGSDNFYLKDGNVILETSLYPVEKTGLKAYQTNHIKTVDCRFKLIGNKLKFEIGEYDKNKDLIIDPLTKLATQFIQPPNGYAVLNDMALAPNNDMVFIGYTNDPQFPHDYGTFKGTSRIFIGRMDASLTLLWTTFFGGSMWEYFGGVDVDDDYIYFCGTTSSSDYPTKNPYQNTKKGFHDGFYTVLYSNGSNYHYSSFIGSNFDYDNQCTNLKVHSNGNIYLVGLGANSNSDFYEYKEIQTQTRSDSIGIGFIIGFDPFFAPGIGLTYNLIFSSLFGGTKLTEIAAIDVDANENIYITGITYSDSSSFNIIPNSFDTYKDDDFSDIYVAKLHLGQNYLEIDYNTYFGSNSNYLELAYPEAIVYGDEGIYFSGFTTYDLPLTSVKAFDNIKSETFQGFLATVNPGLNGSSDLIYSSYFGEGGGYERGSFIYDLDYIDECNRVLFSGTTQYELKNFQGNLIENFTDPLEAMIGVVDISKTGVYTLVDLAYLPPRTDYYPIRVRYDSIYVFAAGNKEYDGDLVFYKLSTNLCQDSCYCPEDVNTWLTLTSLPDEENCDEGQCYVSNTLTIPEDVTCYTHYKVYDGSQMSSVEQIPQNGILGSINRCLNNGATITFTVYLMQGVNDQNPCIIQKSISCDVCCPEGRNDWLELFVRKAGATCTQYQCELDYEFEIPDEYDCFTHYYVDNGYMMTIKYPISNQTGLQTIIQCMEPGTDITIKIYLLQGILDTVPCVIEQTIGCICDCPDSTERNKWLEIFVEPGASPCSEDECKVTHKLSDSIPSCYTHYQLVTTDDDTTITGSVNQLTGPNVTGLDRCIGKGEVLEVKLKLMKGSSDTVPCEISGIAYCNISGPKEPCTPDCFSSTWTQRELGPIKLTSCGQDCYIKVTYLTRIACPDTWNWQDVQIVGIEKFNGGKGSTTNCDGCSDADVYRQALGAIIFKNEMGFHPQEKEIPNCSDIWRVTSAACSATWTEYVYDDTSGVLREIKIIEPCETDCCLRRLRVCRDLVPPYKVKVIDLGPLSDEPACDNEELIIPFDTIPCFGMCDWLEGIYDVYGKQPESDFNEKEVKKLFEKRGNEKSVKISVYQSEAILRILIDETEAKNVTVNILDIKSVNINQSNKQLYRGLNMIEIDISKFISGVYIYEILVDGVRITSDKFILVR